MKQNLKRIARFILVLCMALLVTNCAIDEISQKQEVGKTANIKEARNWFEQYQSAKIFNPLFKNQVYDWENSDVKTLENDLTAIVVPVFDENRNKDYKGKKVLYLYPLGDTKSFETTLYELLPTEESLEGQNFSKALSNFDGYIIAWNLEKGFIESTKFKKSLSIASITSEEIPLNKAKDLFSKAVPDTPAASICLGDVIICNDFKESNGGYSGSGYVYYVNSFGTSGDYTGSYFNSSHGSGGGGGGATPPSVVIKITDKLTGKAKCLNTLLNKSGNSFVQKLLAKFEGKSEFNIQIMSVDKVFSKDGKSELNGKTEHTVGSSEMNIQISTSKANENSALETARVVLHEYIHADIFRKTYTTQDAQSKEVKDFKTTYDAYVTEKHHATMAILYINSMKEALKDFHKNVLTADYNKYIEFYGEAPSDAFYEAMAWGGLSDSNVKPWADLSTARKAEIKTLAGRAKNFSKEVPCPTN